MISWIRCDRIIFRLSGPNGKFMQAQLTPRPSVQGIRERRRVLLVDSCLPPHSRSPRTGHASKSLPPRDPAPAALWTLPDASIPVPYIEPAPERRHDQRNRRTKRIESHEQHRKMATARALRCVASSPSATQRSILAVHRRLMSIMTEAAGAGDPAVHSGEPPSEDYADRPPKFSAAEEATAGAGDKHPSSTKPRPSESTSTTAKERVPPFGPSGKLGSQELADLAAGSTFTQRRHRSSDRAPAGSDPLGDATPGDEEAAARKVREEDREYYRTRKPSPLAEVEFADTRKPVTRHTDGGAEDRMENDVPGTMVRDTADASLARAEAMFREAASRGNPAWPHSRALAAMLARRGGDGAAGAGGTAPWGS
uniref:Uncharacterized protein n=1 Tax=Avena sativa TaxID=4498 RepID=A0ACD5YDJ8_AVESA